MAETKMADFSGTNGDLAVEIVTMDRHRMNIVLRFYEWLFMSYKKKTEILTSKLPISLKQEVAHRWH